MVTASFESYTVLPPNGAPQPCTASAFCEDDRVRFSIGVPRAYGFIEPKIRFVTDALQGEERALCFPMEWDGLDNGFDLYHCDLYMVQLCGAARDGLFFYHYVLCDGVYYSKDEYGTFRRRDGAYPKHQLLVYRRQETEPTWANEGILYHIFVDRFCKSGKIRTVKPGAVLHRDWDHDLMEFAPQRGAPIANNDFFGGDLWGVIEKLDYIEALGTTAIYLSPVFRAASNHKYDTADYEHVDEMFGGDEALIELIRCAAQRGIRVILDGVFNHTGDDSRYFNKYGRFDTVGAYQSPDSPYADWYVFRQFPDDYECWWGIPILPRLNPQSDDCRSYLCDVAEKWTAAGVGGWRLDVADELTDSFIAQLRRTVKQTNPQAILYGEVWENASDKVAYGKRRRYFSGEELDSVMNYPLRDAVIRYLCYGDSDAMRHVCADIYGKYPPFAARYLMNFLGTHDTERILTVLGGEETEGLSEQQLSEKTLHPKNRKRGISLLKLAYLITVGMPGTPCVYYGDEVGMEGYHDPFNRRPYPWGREDRELLAYYQMLGRFRRGNETLRRGALQLLHADRDLLLFARTTPAETLVFGINRSERSYAVRAAFDGADIPAVMQLAPQTGDILPLPVPLSNASIGFEVLSDVRQH